MKSAGPGSIPRAMAEDHPDLSSDGHALKEREYEWGPASGDAGAQKCLVLLSQ